MLEDVDFKEGMKEYSYVYKFTGLLWVWLVECMIFCSKWPTFPQVYMNGELVGGADIMLQMHQNGELVEELEKVGHKSALLEENTE